MTEELSKTVYRVGLLVLIAIAVGYVIAAGGKLGIPVPLTGEEITVTIPQRHRERLEVPEPSAPEIQEPRVESPPVPRRREQIERRKPRQNRAVQAVRIPDYVYVLNGRRRNIEASDSFADVEMPGLNPGSHITVRLYVPGVDGSEGWNFTFNPRTVGSSGLFHARLPRYLHNVETGETIDLSVSRYEFYLDTDDRRFSSCSVRFVRMIEGRQRFRFLDASRVFCGNNDPLPW